MGQGRDLFGGQADAERQVELLFAGDGVVHQVLEQALVGGLAIDESLAKATLKIAISITPAQQMHSTLRTVKVLRQPRNQAPCNVGTMKLIVRRVVLMATGFGDLTNECESCLLICRRLRIRKTAFYGSCARETFGSAGYSFPVRQPAYNCHPISFGDDLLAVSAN